MSKKNIAILGSTGSIGTQTLDVAQKDSNIRILGLTTNTNIELLEQQIECFNPKAVCVMDSAKAIELKERLTKKNITIAVLTGLEGLIHIATLPEVEMVVTAVVGMIGLLPTVEAIKHKKNIALANKETLVTAGEIVMNLAKENNVQILPVDSEHSAIFQSLQGNKHEQVEKLILTASGGPFRDYQKEDLNNVTIKDALNHPNWSMGSKITIDSATLMNKGLEVIEAKHLFNVAPSQIDVVVHRQSIIHSMVEYQDGSVIAQLGCPDMRHPIGYALYYPEREKADYIEKLNLAKIGTLTFEEPKRDVFPCLDLAYKALAIGGTMPAVLNAANEVVVDYFLKGQIAFVKIPDIIHEVMLEHICINRPSLEEILEADCWAREFTRKKVGA